MARLIKPFGKGNSRFTHPDEARRRLDEIAVEKPAPSTPQIIVTHDFKIEDLPDRYRIHNVTYIGKPRVFDWMKELLYHQSRYTQDQWVEMTKNDEVKLPNTMMVYATVAALYSNRNHADPAQQTLVEKVVAEIFKPDITQNYPHTSTRISYRPADITGHRRPHTDNIIHNVGYPNLYPDWADIIGPDAWVNASSGLEEPIRAILGARNLAQVEEVYEWISGKKPRLHRLKLIPGQENLRAVVLGLGLDGFGIGADDDIDAVRPARGVMVHKIEQEQK